MSDRVGTCLFIFASAFPPSRPRADSLKYYDTTYFSSSRRLSTLKVSSQPTSIKTLTPPSSSRSDCDAVDSDSAPWRGQNVNMVAGFGGYLVSSMLGYSMCLACVQVVRARPSMPILFLDPLSRCAPRDQPTGGRLPGWLF